MAEDMSRVLTATPGKIAGATVDNTTANKATWQLLKTMHPAMFFQGGVSHGLHLFVKDIFNVTKAKRGRDVADYPHGYPFEYLLTFTNRCREVVKFFHNNHGPRGQLKHALAFERLLLSNRRYASSSLDKVGNAMKATGSLSANVADTSEIGTLSLLV
jgi:hypothetical protein